MIITIGCPTCGHRYDVAGRLAGKKVRCNECSNTFRVPVPVTMPPAPSEVPGRKRRKRKRVEETLAELLDPAGTPDLSVVPASPHPVASGPDLGERWGYRGFQVLTLVGFIAAWALGWGSPLRMAIGLCVLLGAFLLLPIAAGWPSFERTRRARLLGPILGLEGVKAVQAAGAIALWVFATLIGMDTIHMAALHPPEPAAVPSGK
jgi:hypothetical protein